MAKQCIVLALCANVGDMKLLILSFLWRIPHLFLFFQPFDLLLLKDVKRSRNFWLKAKSSASLVKDCDRLVTASARGSRTVSLSTSL